MILRKPYAILIKNFKLLHLIIFAAMVFLVYKTYGILSFFSEYLETEQLMIGENIVQTVYNSWMFILPIVIIIISLILSGIMILKHKPFVLYVVNIVIYIFVFVMLNISKTTLSSLEVSLLDIRGVKVVRDLTTLAAILQLYPLIKNLVRATGFDIRKFDFKKDLEELEINESDREEFEVNINVDGNKIKRRINSFIRKYKYIYLEHRLVFDITTIFIVVVSTGIWIIFNLKTNNNYNMNETFNVQGFTIKILDAYSTRNNYKQVASTSNEKTSLVVVRANIKSSVKTGKIFSTSIVDLKIDNHVFRHKEQYRDTLLDVGKVYNSTKIYDKYEQILLTFEVPTSYLSKAITIRFQDAADSKGSHKFNNISLPIQSIDSNVTEKELKMFEETTLENTVLKDSKIILNDINIAKVMKVNYKTCLTKDECIDSYEYLKAPLTTNYDRFLMKIDAKTVYSDKLISTNYNTIKDLIKYNGWIEYEIKEKKYTYYLGQNNVEPNHGRSDNIIYIAIPSEISTADKIDVVFKVRNKIYRYKMK